MLAPLCLALLTTSASPQAQVTTPRPGLWRAWVESPGGEIPFGLELGYGRDGDLEAWLRNAGERAPVGRVQRSGESVVFHLDPYDSTLRARIISETELSGEWRRYRGPGKATVMPFGARHGEPRFSRYERVLPEAAEPLVGRWSVRFSSSEEPAVAQLQCSRTGTLGGTFMTTLGDYRYLEGGFDGEQLSLSCFDGAHAFLFEARLAGEGRLEGDFWSRDTWHETWTAVLDPEAELPDEFELTRWREDVRLDSLRFPDLGGQLRSLADVAPLGKPCILVVFGSWCPNCGDSTRYMTQLHSRYGARGLKIVGLAFEFGDTHERNARVLERYVEHHGVEYPILIAGPSHKEAAGKAFPALDRIRAYPTSIFLDAAGKDRAVHTGFSGPATGVAHERLRERFEDLIEGMLATTSRGR